MISGYGMRIFIDAAMAVLLAAAFGFRITGGFAHELLGVCAAAFFIIHNVFNARWYARIFSSGHSFRRGVSTFVNTLLAALAAAVVASGVLSSEYIFGFGGATMELRQVHSISAYWLLIFAGIHTGLHGGFFRVRALCVRPKISAALTVGVVMFGAWAFWERSMFGKLFFGYSFDFVNPDFPSALFFAEILAIPAAVALVVRLLCNFEKTNIKQNHEKK